MIILEQRPEFKQWAEIQLNCTFGNCFTIVNVINNKVVAIAVFSDFRVASVEISFYCDTPRSLTKEFSKAVKNYVFGNWRRCNCYVKPSNKKSIRLIEGLGFKREGLQRKAADNSEDLIMYGMFEEECTIGGHHGQ